MLGRLMFSFSSGTRYNQDEIAELGRMMFSFSFQETGIIKLKFDQFQ